MANTLTFTQVATILNSMMKIAQGREDVQTAVDETSFVAMANTTLQMGYDNFIGALSQTLSKTVWSIRPYSRKLKGLYADEIRFGNHVRKASAIDTDFRNDQRAPLTDGQSVDHWVVNKPKAIQTNWYGSNVYEVLITLPKDQIDQAVTSSAEFGSFVSMVLQNVSDMIEQKHDVTARATLCNFIGAKVKADTPNVRYLISEYMTEKGITDTEQNPFNYKAPANFPDFARWLFGYIETLSDDFEERGVLFHKNFTIDSVAKPINRHTPKSEQILYVLSSVMNAIDTEVKSVTFNEEFLKTIDFERISYWQTPKDKGSIKVQPCYVGEDGQIVDETSGGGTATPVELTNVFGILFDREALGYTTINKWSANTGLNILGGYQNTAWHFTDRPWNDLTENAVVLLLEKAPATNSDSSDDSSSDDTEPVTNTNSTRSTKSK